MSRVRTGHNPNDWREEPGYNAVRHSYGSGGYVQVAGELVTSSVESEHDRKRRESREHQQRRRARGIR